MKQIKRIGIETEIVLTYDDESPEFIETFKSFKETIDSDGSIRDMLGYVAKNVLINSDVDRMIEGIGYVKLDCRPESVGKPYSGISVDDDEPFLTLGIFS